MKISTEALAYWFFRLNGFLTIVNFVVHVEKRGKTGTDVDILGVRFPYRAELFHRPMSDYKEFTKITARPFIAIAEVKRGQCNLNGPWTDREKRNMDRVLRAIGAIPSEDTDDVADALYSEGFFKSPDYYVSLICVGESENSDIQKKYPRVPQILWPEITEFIYQRFRDYRQVKAWHDHWDKDGQDLWALSENSQDKTEFSQSLELIIPT